MGDIRETAHHNANKHSTRSIGKHTGPAPKLDQSKRRGEVGNSKGSAPPGFDKSGGGRKGTLASHLGTAGRGGKGALTQMHSNQLSESPSHEWFESLGSK